MRDAPKLSGTGIVRADVGADGTNFNAHSVAVRCTERSAVSRAERRADDCLPEYFSDHVSNTLADTAANVAGVVGARRERRGLPGDRIS